MFVVGLPLTIIPAIWYVKRVNEWFLYGDANPGILISTTPPLIAVWTDLTKDEGSYPALNVHRERPSDRWEGLEVGTRVAKWRAANRMPRGTIHDLLDHIDHIAKVAGVEHIGIGSDFDGVSVLPEGLEDVACYPRITQGMLDRGYTPEQIRGVLGGNLLRVMRKVEAVSE